MAEAADVIRRTPTPRWQTCARSSACCAPRAPTAAPEPPAADARRPAVLVEEAQAAGTRVRLHNSVGDLDGRRPTPIGRSVVPDRPGGPDQRPQARAGHHRRRHAQRRPGRWAGAWRCATRCASAPPRAPTPGTGLGPDRAGRAGRAGRRPARARARRWRLRRTGLATVAGMSEPLRVVIVDDDALVRSGLAMILRGDPGIELVGEADDGAEGLELISDVRARRGADGHPDAADGRPRGHRAAEPARRPQGDRADDVRRRRPRRARARDGASGFLLKDTPPAEIVDAVHRWRPGTTCSRRASPHS